MLPDNIEIRGIHAVSVTVEVMGKGDKVSGQGVMIQVKGGQNLSEIGEAVTRAAFNALKVAIENACKEK